ncbi:hypothetical protein Tco_1526701, partial [Tanacetum coccineum]
VCFKEPWRKIKKGGGLGWRTTMKIVNGLVASFIMERIRKKRHQSRDDVLYGIRASGVEDSGYIDNLECLGHPVTFGLAVSLILIGLCKEFDGFVQNYNMHSLGKTVNELHAMLKLHEQTLTLPKNNAPALHAIRAGKVQKGKKHKKSQPQMAARGQNQRNGKNKHAYAPKPKIPPPPKREDPVKDLIYHECGKTGH